VRRRLRKKKHLGEYQQLGFEVLADLRADLSDEDIEAFFDRAIDAVEGGNLAFGEAAAAIAVSCAGCSQAAPGRSSAATGATGIVICLRRVPGMSPTSTPALDDIMHSPKRRSCWRCPCRRPAYTRIDARATLGFQCVTASRTKS
jgi:uncharacterized protein YggL (DUF469 family)